MFLSFLYGIAVGCGTEGRQRREDWVFCVTISLRDGKGQNSRDMG